jgi:hypothetical protein
LLLIWSSDRGSVLDPTRYPVRRAYSGGGTHPPEDEQPPPQDRIRRNAGCHFPTSSPRSTGATKRTAMGTATGALWHTGILPRLAPCGISQGLTCLFSQSSPCMMSKPLSCLFSQSCPLYDVQAPALNVLAVLPPARSPSLHPGTSNRCPGISNARHVATIAGLRSSKESCPGRTCSSSKIPAHSASG